LLLPLMLLALWPLRRRWIDPTRSERSTAQLLLLLTLFAFAGYVAYREQILPWYWDTNLLDTAIQPMANSAPRDRTLIPLALLGRAVALLGFPLKLSPEYGLAVITPRQDLADPFLYLGALSLVATIAGAWLVFRRRAWTVLYLLFCAALTYFMVSNVKLIGVVFAERLLYLPSAFVLILAAMALARLPRRMMVLAVSLIVIACSVRTVTYAARWNDRLSFYQRSLQENPRAVRLHVLLAAELIQRGEFERARVTIDQALAIAPDYWKLWSQASRVAVEQGRFADARAFMARAQALNVQAFFDGVQERLAATQAATRP
jgi:tetratricopeptide (TPR) repeat protein